MNENQFWSLIENAWASIGGRTEERKALVEGTLPEDELEELAEDVEAIMPAMRSSLEKLTQPELLAFDRILERKLWEIDREEIQEYTDGSDDGFLYARGFIVAAGHDYFDAVNTTPSLGRMNVECEDMCYLSFHVYEEKFGEIPKSKISRESTSNLGGWPKS